MEFKGLSHRTAVALAIGAVFCFHLAWKVEGLASGLAITAFLVIMTLLCWSQTPRLAFGLGLIIGGATFIPQTAFFWGTVGAKIIPLWILLSLSSALFLWLGRSSIGQWPKWGMFLLPVFWVGLESSRSELVSPWLAAGLASPSVSIVTWGSYGSSAIIVLMLALGMRTKPCRAFVAGCMALLVVGSIVWHTPPPTTFGPKVAGIQLEGGFDSKELHFLSLDRVFAALDKVVKEQPQADIIVLPEYTRPGMPEEAILAWARQHQKYLVLGGRVWVSDTEFYNSAFAVDPQGQIVFWQAKCRPVPIVPDGLPAESQAVWRSPWGPLGIAICYDLAYSSVIDELVRKGAQGLIVISMDLQEWGSQEHRIAARIAQVRAAEYRIPIFRVSSSAGSALVGRNGVVVAQAAAGQFQTLSGNLALADGRIPIDRHLLWPATGVTLLLLAYVFGLAASNGWWKFWDWWS